MNYDKLKSMALCFGCICSIVLDNVFGNGVEINIIIAVLSALRGERGIIMAASDLGLYNTDTLLDLLKGEQKHADEIKNLESKYFIINEEYSEAKDEEMKDHWLTILNEIEEDLKNTNNLLNLTKRTIGITIKAYSEGRF